jgi:hypothetical protein
MSDALIAEVENLNIALAFVGVLGLLAGMVWWIARTLRNTPRPCEPEPTIDRLQVIGLRPTPEPERSEIVAALHLDQDTYRGWMVREGKVVTPLVGPVRIRVVGRYWKAIDFSTRPGEVAYGPSPRFDAIRQLADQKGFREAAHGPEYEVELLDFDNKVVRLWLNTTAKKHALQHLLNKAGTPEIILGHSRRHICAAPRTFAVRTYFLVPSGWLPLDKSCNVW